jgi:predicted permease
VRRWLRLRLGALFRRRALERDLRRELESHLELEAQEQQESGLSREEAAYAARRAFGNKGLVTEEVRETWGWAWLERFLGDVRHGARSLARTPRFTLVAVLTLALGIGANTAIFSVVETVLFQPLPFSAPDRLVRIYSTKDGNPIAPNGSGFYGGPSVMDMRDFAQTNHTFQNMAAYDTWRKNVSFGGAPTEPEQMWVGLVPGAYFETLDVKPILGRVFRQDESYTGKHYVAAISADLWKTRFGGGKAILGRKIYINDEPYTIVAVMPDVIPKWMEGKTVQIWTPLGFADSLGDLWTEVGRAGWGWYSVGRITPGVSMERAQADLAAIAAGLAATHPVDRGIGVAIERLADTRAHNLRPMLALLMGAASLILLIACVNLATLLLARNAARQRELAVRAALGSGRSALLRLLLAEALLLVLAGGGLGLFLAYGAVAGLARIRPSNLPQLSSLGIDWRVLAFTSALSLFTSLLFGLTPALAGSRVNLIDALKQGGRSGTAGRPSHRARNVLVVTEMAMSLMLLVGAGLLVQSISRLQREELGVRRDHLLKGHFYMPPARYPNPASITRFCDAFGKRIRALPGVAEASVTTIYPPTYNWTQMLEIPGRPVTRVQDIPSVQFGLTDAHFLRTMGIPLIRGRDFADSDTATTRSVALVSQELVRRYLPKEDPIGQQVHIGPPPYLHIPPGDLITDSADATIVGVFADFRNNGLTAPPEPQILVLYSQHPLVNYGFKDVVIRTAADPLSMAPAIRLQLRQMDPDMPFAEVQTLDQYIEQHTGGTRFVTVLLVVFAASGLALAVVGIYGVVSYLVAQRTQELAVRLAIGARPAAVLWLVLRQGVNMALVGAAIGLLGAFAARHWLAGLLFGVSPADPATFFCAAVFLVLVAATATAIPGARAMRIEPVRALREE